MKRIGLIGGFSWFSTAEYYRFINTLVGEKLGFKHGAALVLINCDAAAFHEALAAGERKKAVSMLTDAARRAEKGGAEFLLIGANGLHCFFDDIKQAVSIPILHIADAVAQAVQEKGLKKVGLLGVKSTMEATFYPEKLKSVGADVIVPESKEREWIHKTINDELMAGRFTNIARKGFIKEIDGLISRGAQGIILGCTEIPLLIKSSDTYVPTFSTTELHCRAAVDRALS